MTLALGGVFTSIDWDSMVDGLMQAEYRPYNRLSNQKAEIQSQQKAVNTIKSAFNSFQSALTSLSSESSLRQVKASSSDSAVVTASAGSGVYEGTHNLEVNQLAQSHRIVQNTGVSDLGEKIGPGGSKSNAANSNTVADADAPWLTTTANGASYTFDFGDEEAFTVEFGPSTDYTMNEVVSMINTAAGYTAAAALEDPPGTFSLELAARYKGATGTMTQTLTSGDAIDELNDEADWAKTDGTDPTAGIFSYTYAGTTRTLNLSADASIEDLGDAINNDASNPGVTASILQYNGTYHLVLDGNETGASNTVTINDAQTTAVGFDTADFFVAQQAQSAEYRINGSPPAGTWIESESNTLSDVVSGVTFNLAGTGTATVSISRNTDAIAGNIEKMVSQYNALVETVDLYVGYNVGSKTGGILQGDSTLRSLLTPVRNMLTTPMDGFDVSNDGLSMAAHLGLEVDRDGVLSFDRETFDSLLETNYDDIIRFFGAENRAVLSSDYFSLDSALDTAVAGEYEIKTEFSGGVLDKAYFREQGDTGWTEMDVDGNTITGREGTDLAGLALNVTWDGVSDGTGNPQTSDLRFQDGMANALDNMLDEMLDSSDGPFAVRVEQYDTEIESIESRMEILTDRLARKEKTYTAKFARLEASLAQLQGQQAAYQSLFSQLAGSSTNQNSGKSS
jgi:flagellar hook-associated protein 2